MGGIKGGARGKGDMDKKYSGVPNRQETSDKEGGGTSIIRGHCGGMGGKVGGV